MIVSWRGAYVGKYRNLCDSPPMSRQPRLDVPDALHHVMVRGIGRPGPVNDGLTEDDPGLPKAVLRCWTHVLSPSGGAVHAEEDARGDRDRAPVESDQLGPGLSLRRGVR